MVDFLEQMIRATPIEVIAAFSQALYACDLRGTLATLGRVPVVVLTGEKDRLISPVAGRGTGRRQIPGAELVLGTGRRPRPYPGGPRGGQRGDHQA